MLYKYTLYNWIFSQFPLKCHALDPVYAVKTVLQVERVYILCISSSRRLLLRSAQSAAPGAAAVYRPFYFLSLLVHRGLSHLLGFVFTKFTQIQAPIYVSLVDTDRGLGLVYVLFYLHYLKFRAYDFGLMG